MLYNKILQIQIQNNQGNNYEPLQQAAAKDITNTTSSDKPQQLIIENNHQNTEKNAKLLFTMENATAVGSS